MNIWLTLSDLELLSLALRFGWMGVGGLKILLTPSALEPSTNYDKDRMHSHSEITFPGGDGMGIS